MYKIKYTLFGYAPEHGDSLMVIGTVIEGPKGGNYYLDFNTSRQLIIDISNFNKDELHRINYFAYEVFEELAKKLNNKQVIRIKDSSETLTKLRKRIDIGKVLLGSKQYDTIRNNLIL